MKININGIATQTIIGCYDYERNKEQEVLIDICIELYQSNWTKPDILETTVDYDGVVDFIRELVPNTSYNLLESLSEHISEKLLKQYPLIKVAHVVVAKPAICGIKAKHITVSHTKKRKFKVALALGSNDTLAMQQIISAIEILGEHVSDISIGRFYKTIPVGYTKQNDFINTALIGYVNLRPEELLGKIKVTEKLMGKHEVFANGPRSIDIDLILFDDLIYTHNFLTVPHKSMHLRDFVLKPLADVAGNWVHPVYNKTIATLLTEVGNTSIIGEVDYYK
ncbi:MAG: folK [Burkholderiales bacterium]|jgi:dihydroneopterin aldolase/2-amino-4-hydroxy-6-hydroxymethyldihydropteridine diphosphokinase|nr:folK [Burkholderiales bacterium]